MRKFLGSATIVMVSMSLLILAGCGGKGGSTASTANNERSAADITACYDGALECLVCLPDEDAGCDAASLTNAVAQVAVGGTLYLEAGTYPESITIAKSLTIVGVNSGTSACFDTPRSGLGESVIGGTITIQAPPGQPAPDNIVIDGVTVAGDIVNLSGTNVVIKNNFVQYIDITAAEATLLCNLDVNYECRDLDANGCIPVVEPPNVAPAPSITASPTSGEAALSVSFAGVCGDSDGSCVSYVWDFGDGIGTSNAQNASYTFSTAGTYTVTLTVTDNDGATGEAAVDITVSSAPPPPVLGCKDVKAAQIPILTAILAGLTPASDNHGKGKRNSHKTAECYTNHGAKNNSSAADAQHVKEAIKQLNLSLEARNWSDVCVLSCKYGKKAMEYERQAVEELEHVKATGTIGDQISAVIDAIVGVDKSLAEAEIAAAPASCKYISYANIKLAEGVSLTTVKGHRAHAIQKFRYAWFKASNCICKNYKYDYERDRDERDEGNFDKDYEKYHCK